MCGWHLELCDPTVTHGPYLSALEIKWLVIKRYINSSVYFTLLTYLTAKIQSVAIQPPPCTFLPVIRGVQNTRVATLVARARKSFNFTFLQSRIKKNKKYALISMRIFPRAFILDVTFASSTSLDKDSEAFLTLLWLTSQRCCISNVNDEPDVRLFRT